MRTISANRETTPRVDESGCAALQSEPITPGGRTMPAYIVAEIDVTDASAYEPYKKMAGESIQRHGGRFLARGGRTVSLEGEKPKRVVVVEFPTVDAAEKFYHSPDYQTAVKIRQKASKGRLYIVEG